MFRIRSKKINFYVHTQFYLYEALKAVAVLVCKLYHILKYTVKCSYLEVILTLGYWLHNENR